MTLTNELEKEIMQVYLDYWDAYLKGDTDKSISYIDERITMFGSTEDEVFTDKQGAANFFTSTAAEIAGKVDFRNRNISIVPLDEMVLVTERMDLYILSGNEWAFYAKARLSSVFKHQPGGWKLIHQHGSFPDHMVQEGESIAFESITKENLQLKEAVKRRTVELEQKNRELEIETALERVRARAMAMQTSDELKELIGTVFTELTKLDLVLTRCVIMIYDGRETTSHWWMANSEDPNNPAGFFIKRHEHPPMAAYFKAWHERELKYSYALQGKVKQEWDEFLFSETELKNLPDFVIEGMKAPDLVYLNASFNNFGNLTLASLAPLSDEHFDILLRFAKVFDLTYTRFNDLQKAEAQARESQIQLALERVRARTMAMQKSEELPEAANLLFLQVQSLGIPAWSCGYNILAADKRSSTCIMSSEGEIQVPFVLPLTEHSSLLPWYEAIQNNLDFFVYGQGGEDLEAHYNYLATVPGLEKVFKQFDDAGISLPTDQINHLVRFTNGFLLFITYEPVPHAHDIFKRFGKVFEQTYTRFLDLRKAETQTRAAQIELAVERVRAKALAMHHSPQILDVVTTLRDEMLSLEIPGIVAATIYLQEEEEGYIRMWDLSSVTKMDDSFHVALDVKFKPEETDPGLFIRRVWNNKENYFVEKQEAHDMEITIEWLRQYYPEQADEATQFFAATTWKYLLHPTVQLKNGKMSVDIMDTEPPADMESILVKMGAAFDLAYKRFVDLKKAEAQTREAQIETGLERVRYSAMAMQSSEDVGTASAVVFNEISLLGVEAMRCGVTIIHHDMTADVWAATTTREGKEMKGMGSINFNKHPLWIGLFDAWKNKEENFSYDLKGDDLRAYYKVLTNSPNYNSSYIQNQEFPDHTFYACLFEQGAVFTFSLLPHDDEKRKVLKRFTAVFSLTFRRYLDLKQAEAQTREAKIEASLERVRSKAMAMHNSQDLSDTIHVFYSELQTFSITPRRCGVGLLDKENKDGDLFTWNTTDKGESLEMVGKIKMDCHPVLENVYSNWINQTEYHPILRGHEIKEYYEAIKPQMAFPVYSLDEVMYGYFFFFNEGGVYAWTQIEMKEEELQIYRRFTSVLSLTYKRYKDLQQAEANAREAQIETGLERVRSRTMAMHKSDELAETAVVLFKQMIGLGIAPNRLYIAIINDNSGDLEFWITDENGDKVSSRYIVNIHKNISIKTMYEGWVAKKKTITIDMQGKELEDWLTYWKEEFHVPFKPGAALKRRVQNIAYFSKGFVAIASPDDQPGSTINLLERFAAVFNLTFTRFKDLKIAEAHAEQAELDLIQLKEEKKRTEGALNELQATQKQLIQSEKMASLGELTAGIAHEIQNPLNFVNNFSEVSTELVDEMNEEIDKGNSEEAKQIAQDLKLNLEKINHHGKRAGDIVKGMLQHSRNSSGVKERTNINALADEYLRLAYHGLRAKDKTFNATMKTDFDDSIGNINIIPQDIGRVVLNLITNAFYVVNEKSKQNIGGYEPTVSVSTKRKNDKVEISVKDNGNGIPQKVLDKIFQPFFTTKPTGQGTGLGLSLSYDIVKAHGGEIKVSTKENEGTDFIIQLPDSTN